MGSKNDRFVPLTKDGFADRALGDFAVVRIGAISREHDIAPSILGSPPKKIMRKQFCVHGHDTSLCGRAINRGCRLCVLLGYKKHNLKRNYNLEFADYEKLRWKQKNLCGICSKAKKLVVDHDHKTGKIRGLLCTNCNQALGGFYDSKEILQSAINYLK